MKFQTLACTVHNVWHALDFILIFSKGHNSRKGDNSDKKKKHQLFFHKESIYEISKTLGRTVFDGRTDGQLEINMLLNYHQIPILSVPLIAAAAF